MASDRAAVPPTPQSHPEHLTRSAGLAGAATGISRILGLVRETVLAAVFGAGNEMDAFNVAFRIPNLVRDLFAEGAMSAAFVPTFSRRIALSGKRDAWRLGSFVMNALLLSTGALVVIGWMLTTPLVTAYAGGYASVPGKLALTIELTRTMLPFLTLVALAAAAMGMLNSLGHYFMPALSPAAFNVAAIASALILPPLMHGIGQPPVMALAIGTLVGGVGQVLLQWPPLHREGFRYSPTLDVGDPGLRQVLLLMGPGTIGLAATQVNLFVNTQLAVSQGTGAVSWLLYAFRLMYLPIGLFGVSIATAVLPAVARQLAVKDSDAAIHTVGRGLALMLLVNVPATVGLFLLATPIVQLLLERGLFLRADTVATALAVQCYAVGLIGHSAVRITSPVFYALGRSRIAVWLSALSIAVNLALSLVLVRAMGFSGLALGTSGAALLNGGVSLFLVRRHLGGIDHRHLASTFIRILLASAAMGLAVTLVNQAMPRVMPGSGTLTQLIRLGVTISAGIGTLAAMAWLLRIPEWNEALDRGRRRLRDWLVV